jgi:perosamine synthetase
MFPACAMNVHAADIPKRAINLPSFHDMSTDEQDRVCSVVEALLHAR